MVPETTEVIERHEGLRVFVTSEADVDYVPETPEYMKTEENRPSSVYSSISFLNGRVLTKYQGPTMENPDPDSIYRMIPYIESSRDDSKRRDESYIRQNEFGPHIDEEGIKVKAKLLEASVREFFGDEFDTVKDELYPDGFETEVREQTERIYAPKKERGRRESTDSILAKLWDRVA